MKTCQIAAIVCFILATCIPAVSFGQPTIFSVMRDPVKIADEHFDDGHYARAVELYEQVVNRNSSDVHSLLRLAQCYYNLKDFENAVKVYDRYLKRPGSVLSADAMFQYAEAQTVLKNYPVALEFYKQCLAQDPENEIISRKIWRLSNLEFMFEDSVHYHVRPLAAVNTRWSEICAVPDGDGIVFLSNRKELSPVEMAAMDSTAGFYNLYVAEWKSDTLLRQRTLAAAPRQLSMKGSGSRLNMGPAALYNKGTEMVYVAAAQKPRPDGRRTLGLYFARREGNTWKPVAPYTHNDDAHSITDVTINEEGTTMYFSSDMRGGFGGKDIYQADRVDDHWLRPRNVGEPVNTSRNEAFPYLHLNGTLYFASDGHPGMGDLDIFQSTILPKTFTDPVNLGFPINSSHDDFGLSFDSLATHGYFSSNRKNGGFDDDIFEFDLDLQTYPFEITGVLRVKQHALTDPLEVQTWPNMRMKLIDTRQNVEVQQTKSDPEGLFILRIPYYSSYHLLIVDDEGNEHKASLDLGRFRQATNDHEIIVVKELFGKSTDK